MRSCFYDVRKCNVARLLWEEFNAEALMFLGCFEILFGTPPLGKS